VAQHDLQSASSDLHRDEMSDALPHARTFDREEVALILRDAAQLDTPGVDVPSGEVPQESAGDGLTLAEIARAAAAVGISPAAVTAAWLRRSLVSMRGADGRVHVSHEVAGELTVSDYERLIGDVRTIAGEATIRRIADGVEMDVGEPVGGPGSLTMHVRSAGGVTTLSFWTRAPVLTAGDTVGWALLGIPPVLFPLVAATGGHWQLLGTAAVSLLGTVVGAASGVGVNRWRRTRWLERVEGIVVPITLRLSELIAQRGASDAPRALPDPR
jgi:hypothetical protein